MQIEWISISKAHANKNCLSNYHIIELVEAVVCINLINNNMIYNISGSAKFKHLTIYKYKQRCRKRLMNHNEAIWEQVLFCSGLLRYPARPRA